MSDIVRKHAEQIDVLSWRPVVGYPDYEVSECGDVRRAVKSPTRRRQHRLRGFIDIDGYLRYSLKTPDGKTHNIPAHRLVAEAFIGLAPSPDHEVAHKTGSRVASHWRDLRWATRQQNHDDIQAHGTALKGERNGRSKITEDDVRAIRRDYREIKRPGSGRRVAELDARYGLDRGTIINIARGKTWRHVPFDGGGCT